jgi:hypothetical protein
LEDNPQILEHQYEIDVAKALFGVPERPKVQSLHRIKEGWCSVGNPSENDWKYV